MERKNAVSWKIAGPVGLALIGIVALVVGCAGGGTIAAPSSGDSVTALNSISVSGTGKASGAPDIAFVQLGIDVVAADVGEAIAQSNAAMENVQKAVKGQGVEEADMQTVNFNVYPEDVYDPQTGQPTGQRRYRVANALSVKVRDIAKVGDVIDAALGAGATNITGLSFSVEDASKLEAEARAKAVEDAKVRAQQLADLLGVKLGDPVIVSEGYASVPPVPYPFYAEKAADGLGGAVPITPGQLEVSVQVNVSFAFTK